MAKLKDILLVCNRDWCDFQEEQRIHVVPTRAWHAYEELGKTEQHLCSVEVLEEE